MVLPCFPPNRYSFRDCFFLGCGRCLVGFMDFYALWEFLENYTGIRRGDGGLQNRGYLEKIHYYEAPYSRSFMVTGHSATKGLKQKVATKACNKVRGGGGFGSTATWG